jgi:DNA-binding GntR family transcriptional regulator
MDESLSVEDIAKVAAGGAPYGVHSGFVTKRDYVVSAVRDMISTGELKPGDHLRQDDLAERLNVSSTPLREAMLLLKAEGLLTYTPHKGVRIHEFTVPEELEACRIRSVLEPLAVRLAVPQLSDRQLRRLHECHERLTELADAGAWSEYNRLNRWFHQIYVEGARSPLLDDLISRVWARTPGHMRVTDERITRQRGRELNEEHDRLVRATLARDPDLAAHFMQEHLERMLLYQKTHLLPPLREACDHAPNGEAGDEVRA